MCRAGLIPSFELDTLLLGVMKCTLLTKLILGQFLDRYEAKQNPRNTINDIIILSTAIEHSVPLLTEDNLLRRFSAELMGALCFEQPHSQLLIDFTAPEVSDRRRPFESKGYINRGWQVLERRGAR